MKISSPRQTVKKERIYRTQTQNNSSKKQGDDRSNAKENLEADILSVEKPVYKEFHDKILIVNPNSGNIIDSSVIFTKDVY